MGNTFSLHTLNISWTSLEIETLREFANYVNENMYKLNIAGCRKTMSDDSKTHTFKSFINTYISKKRFLGINFFLYSVLKKIVHRCPQLRELDLSDCTTLTSHTIDIVANLKHLEYLSLSRAYNINVSAYL